MSVNASLAPVVVGTDGSGQAGAAVRHPEQPVVVVGVDGSECSERAIELAFDEASRHGCELVAVHAWTRYGYIPPEERQRDAEVELAESLAGYAEKYPDVPVRRLVVEDNPARRLLALSADARMVVVGSHGRGGFAGMTLGSVSQAVLHGADCPVVIVRAR
ncbi:universal stress protein [Nocardia jiangsuensis]|uniref:Universal stress protein n=1 Tax=Nocardia jiangsuensis TaxID=1691563 RepID=A0ABV8DNE2_9NOCA